MTFATLLTALFNGAWQGALLAVAALVAFRFVRRLNATTMFAMWVVIFAICIALPVANAVFAPKPVTIRVIATSPGRLVPKHVEKPTNVPMPAQAPRQSLSDELIGLQRLVLARANVILAFVAAIALLRLGLLARDIALMLFARRRVSRIVAPVDVRTAVRRPFAFASSPEFTIPCVLGFVPALIVIPDDLLRGPEAALQSVVLHEVEHVRRFDDLQTIVFRILGAFAFFCPGVWMALRELALYRERICDDAAISGNVNRAAYAATLTDRAQWAQNQGAPVPGLIFKRKQLVQRLEMLLDSAVSHSLRTNRRFAIGAAVAILACAAIVIRLQVPVVAESIVLPVDPNVPAPIKVHVVVPQVVVPRVVVPHVAVQVNVPRITVRPLIVTHVPPIAPIIVKPLVAVHIPTVQIPNVHIPDVHISPVQIVAAIPKVQVVAESDDLLDALDAVGMHNLSVDQLLALRDHGVSGRLVRASAAYFGGRVTPEQLTSLADHGVSTDYLDALRSDGVQGLAVSDVVSLADHGVNERLVRMAREYFNPPPSAGDMIALADHGASAEYLSSLASAGVRGISAADVVRLVDHGVDAAYIVKVRRINPNAKIDDIIRLRDSGF
jgi:beta-lactamase regulating signal transducer with metallopeptidase domain